MEFHPKRSLILVLLLAMVCALFWSVAAQAAAPATIVFRGSADRKWVALTFDDNTAPGPSLACLQVLEEYQVPATLFVIGWAVSAYPDVTDAIAKGVARGLLEVGDHSATHPDLTAIPVGQLADQIGGGTRAFEQATETRTVPLFRPPYGHNNSAVAQVAGDNGFSHLMLWDVGTEDWTGESAQVIENNIVSRAHNGAIILLHLGAEHTAEALPGIITRLRDQGYQFVQVSTMLKGNRAFLDVDPNTETGSAIALMSQAGNMAGYNDNYFGPRDTLTRQQAAKVVSMVAGIHTTEIEHAGGATFADVPPTLDAQGAIQPYPFDFVEEAADAGLVRGSTDAQGRPVFRPYSAITRVQLAQILARMVRQLKGYPSALEGTPSRFADVPEYAAADVALVAGLGLMKGYSSEQFGAWQNAQRGHVALVMERFLELPLR